MTSFVDTRDALHQLARFVLGEELKGTTELVTLRPTPGGFGQPERLVDGLQRRVRIDGTDLVVQTGEHERWTPITSVAAAAATVGIPVRADVPAPDAPLAVDPAHADTLAVLYAFVAAALDDVRRRHAHDDPTILQLFPHHFDVAISITEVNLGGSPGDEEHERPYLYVGPWSPKPSPLWNESWGASIPWTTDMDLGEAISFYESMLAAATAI